MKIKIENRISLGKCNPLNILAIAVINTIKNNKILQVKLSTMLNVSNRTL